MAIDPRPTNPIKWADVLLNNGPLGGPNRIDPDTQKQDAGWAWQEKPAFETLNGWMYNVFTLLDWAADSIETHESQIGGLGTTFGSDENGMSTIAFPGGGTFSNVGNVSGAFKITLPQSWTDTRLKFIVDIFEEDTGLTSSILISGVNVSGTTEWTDTQASIIAGDKTLRVRWGHDGLNVFVLIGSITDTFISPHVRVRDWTGHGGASFSYVNWVTGWLIAAITSEAGLTFTGNDIEAAVSSSVPSGAVVALATDTVPTGFFECDGAAVSRTTYAGLFASIGTSYGVGDGSTTFNLPDYRGEFLRGFDNGAGNDPDAASRLNRGDGVTGDNIGTKQLGEIESHLHGIDLVTAGGFSEIQNIGGSATFSGISQTNLFGGNETRPRNVNVMYCIKF